MQEGHSVLMANAQTADAATSNRAHAGSAMAVAVLIVGWLIPGGGHLMQKRWWRGLRLRGVRHHPAQHARPDGPLRPVLFFVVRRGRDSGGVGDVDTQAIGFTKAVLRFYPSHTNASKTRFTANPILR